MAPWGHMYVNPGLTEPKDIVEKPSKRIRKYGNRINVVNNKMLSHYRPHKDNAK